MPKQNRVKSKLRDHVWLDAVNRVSTVLQTEQQLQCLINAGSLLLLSQIQTNYPQVFLISVCILLAHASSGLQHASLALMLLIELSVH